MKATATDIMAEGDGKTAGTIVDHGIAGIAGIAAIAGAARPRIEVALMANAPIAPPVTSLQRRAEPYRSAGAN